MNLRPFISVPLPWLTSFTGRFLGKGGITPVGGNYPRKKAATRKRHFFKLPRTLSITSVGRWYIGILLLIGIAAINTANNLLYLVSSTLLSLIIVSGVISEHTMRRLRIERTLPAQIFKDTPTVVRVSIKNVKKVFSSFSFSVKELPSPGITSEPIYVLKLGPSEETVKTAAYTFTKRGVVLLSGVKISTRFPFGLFLKGRKDDSPAEALVYPSIRHPFIKTLSSVRAAEDGISPAGKGYGPQIYGLRDYIAGDDSRFIYWKGAARTERLLIREFEKEKEQKVTVVFDNFKAPEAIFEGLVDEAASVANHFIERGFSVGLKTLERALPPAPGPNQIARILHTLALITPAEGAGVATVRII